MDNNVRVGYENEEETNSAECVTLEVIHEATKRILNRLLETNDWLIVYEEYLSLPIKNEDTYNLMYII